MLHLSHSCVYAKPPLLDTWYMSLLKLLNYSRINSETHFWCGQKKELGEMMTVCWEGRLSETLISPNNTIKVVWSCDVEVSLPSLESLWSLPSRAERRNLKWTHSFWLQLIVSDYVSHFCWDGELLMLLSRFCYLWTGAIRLLQYVITVPGRSGENLLCCTLWSL